MTAHPASRVAAFGSGLAAMAAVVAAFPPSAHGFGAAAILAITSAGFAFLAIKGRRP